MNAMDPRHIDRLDRYPSGFIAFLRDLGECIAEVNGVAAVILAGSTARGEASVRVDEHGWQTLGDVELLLVCDKEIEVTQVDRVLSELASISYYGFTVPPLIESSTVLASALRRQQRKIWIFETREAACCIGGDSAYLNLLPKVTIENLDFNDLNEIYLHRLGALGKAFYPYVIKTPGLDDDEQLRYVIARNTLDILTWLLPYTGVLIAGYTARAEYLKAHPALPFISSLSPEFLEKIVRFTEWKLDPDAMPKAGPLDLDACLDEFAAAAHWVQLKTGKEVLGRFRRRRRFLRAAQMASKAITMQQVSPSHALRWTFRDTFRLRTEALMHVLRQAARSGQPTASWIDQARRYISDLVLVPTEPPGDDPLVMSRMIVESADVHVPRHHE